MSELTLQQKAEHCQRELKRQRDRRANGLCIRCGKPNDTDRTGECSACGGPSRVHLPEETVAAIKLIGELRVSAMEVADTYGVPLQTVRNIWAGKPYVNKLNRNCAAYQVWLRRNQ